MIATWQVCVLYTISPPPCSTYVCQICNKCVVVVTIRTLIVFHVPGAIHVTLHNVEHTSLRRRGRAVAKVARIMLM